MAGDITVGDVVFYNDPHEAWMTNLVAEVVEDRGVTVIITTRGYNAEVPKEDLLKLPVDKDFPIYPVTRYEPKHESPD